MAEVDYTYYINAFVNAADALRHAEKMAASPEVHGDDVQMASLAAALAVADATADRTVILSTIADNSDDPFIRAAILGIRDYLHNR